MAVTLGDYILSDIAEADFTAGMPTAAIRTYILVKVADAADADGDGITAELIGDGHVYGDFHYLGFNDRFVIRYLAKAEGTRILAGLDDRPESSNFRVGLRQGDEDIDPDDFDFDHYRITIEYSSEHFLEY